MTGSSAVRTGEKNQAENCFVRGRHNPRGLNIPYYYQDEKIAAHYIPGDIGTNQDDFRLVMENVGITMDINRSVGNL